MASFDPLAPIDPWMLRPTAADSWYPDAFARETESALTKALQQSFFTQPIPSSLFLNQTDYCINTPSASTVTGSASGSEPETPGSNRRETGSNLGVTMGKTKKRKSRASKRSMTTFIQADPANFRQMVQQVTGVQFVGNGNGSLPVKPEAVRQPFVNKLQGMLPTLDTSAYLLDVQKKDMRRIPATVNANGFSGMSQGAVNGGAGGEFYSFCNFPTLESSI